MNKNAKIAIIIILIFTVFSTGIYFVVNVKSATNKIKITGTNFEFPKTLKDLKDLTLNYFFSTVKVTVSNFSDNDYTINQLNIDLFVQVFYMPHLYS